MSSIADTVEDIQMRIVFQDDTIQQLNDVVVKQDAIIRRLEEEMSLLKTQFWNLREQVEGNGGGGGGDDHDERPPHY